MDDKQLNDKIEDTLTDPVERLLQDKKPSSTGKWVIVLALLLAIVSVAASGWLLWQAYAAGADGVSRQEAVAQLQLKQERLANSVSTFEAQLDATESPVDPAEFSSMGEKVASVERKITAVQGQSTEGMASVAAVQGSVRSIEQRLSVVEAGLVNVAVKSQNSSVELEIAEIDFLLRAANERLQLFSDPIAADLALQAADVQIEALNDPMFLSVRQRIASSRHALAAIPRVDRVQLSAKISELQNNVPALPFRGEAVARPEPELPADAGWWESLKQTLSSLVTVRSRASEDQSLLSLADKDYLRQGLWLQFESARLALMRNDAATYTASLTRVDATLEQFFENGSSPVQAMLLELAAIMPVEIAPEMPDISAAWTQLRQLRDSRRLLQTAPAVEAGDPLE